MSSEYFFFSIFLKVSLFPQILHVSFLYQILVWRLLSTTSVAQLIQFAVKFVYVVVQLFIDTEYYTLTAVNLSIIISFSEFRPLYTILLYMLFFFSVNGTLELAVGKIFLGFFIRYWKNFNIRKRIKLSSSKIATV